MSVDRALKFAVMAGIVVGQTAVADSPVRPTPIEPGDRCYRCDRLIADRRVAGETVTEANVAYKSGPSAAC